MPRTDLFAKTERPAIALDSGSSSIKIGFCGEETPRAVVPTTGLEEANGAVPLKAGVVQDWEAMEVYWDHAFTHALGVDTEVRHAIHATERSSHTHRRRASPLSTTSLTQPVAAPRPPQGVPRHHHRAPLRDEAQQGAHGPVAL